MADDKKNEPKSLLKTSVFSKMVDSINTNLNKIYQSTWFGPSSNRESRENIKKDIDLYLDKIISNNINISGEGNISRLLKRLQQTQNDQTTVNAFKNLFEDRTLMSSVFTSYSQNRYLFDYDAEIDTVLKYMPKLKEALLILRDNVLSTDHFSRDYISAINISDISNDTLFDKRLEELKTQYKLLENLEKWYFNASKYGEDFIYIVPYSKAIAQIMKDKQNTVTRGTMNMESFEYDFGTGKKRLPDKFKRINESVLKGFGNLEIELCHSKCIMSVLEEHESFSSTMESLQEGSMVSYFEEEVIYEEKPSEKVAPDSKKPINLDDVNVAHDKDTISTNLSKKMEKVDKRLRKEKIISDGDMEKYLKTIDKDNTADDGILDLNREKDNKRTKFDIPGAIVKHLDRHNVIPIMIDEETCLGYYYFEFQKQRDMLINNSMRLSDPMMAISAGNNFSTMNDQAEQDKALRYISSELSKFIDASFINKNQDLKKEIYAILKYNQIYNTPTPNKMRITYIPPTDIHHIFFELDPNTHKGLSDLHDSMLPAKLYSAMYITTSIMTMTRGYDKRVFYVNPGIETNLTEAMMNVISQIKQGNFGLRQIRNNLNQVLNIQGRFNDYFVLKAPNGDSPLNMEVISGQNVEIKTELMNLLEEMAINPTGVPLDLLQTRMNSMDYAIQATMSSSKFLRLVFKRQAKVNKIFSRIIQDIYNYHFKTNDQIEFTLPPPNFLTVNNNTQYLDNLNNYATHLAEIEWDGTPEDENGKQWLIKTIKKKMAGSYYNKDFIQDALREAKHKAQLFPLPPKQPGQ